MKERKKAKLPSASEELRQRLRLCFSCWQHVFAACGLCGDKVYLLQMSRPDGSSVTQAVNPSWTLLLHFEHRLRKEAYKSLKVSTAYNASDLNTKHMSRNRMVLRNLIGMYITMIQQQRKKAVQTVRQWSEGAENGHSKHPLYDDDEWNGRKQWRRLGTRWQWVRQQCGDFRHGF